MAIYGSIQNGQILDVRGNKVFLNGKLLPCIPSCRNVTSVSQVNDHIYVNGYEWTGTKWKRTFPALWHMFF